MEIGSISVGVDFTGVEDAIRQAEEFKSEMQDLQETTGDLEADTTGVQDQMEGVAGAQEETTEQTGRLNSWLTILSGTSIGTALSLGTLSSAAGTATGAIGSLYATIASPALLAAGIAGLGLLSTELTGITDVTPVAEQEIGGLVGIGIDLAAIFGGPVIASLRAMIPLLTGDIPKAMDVFSRSMANWEAFVRGKLGDMFLEFAEFSKFFRTGIRGIGEAIQFGFIKMINRAVGALNNFIGGFNNLAGEIPGIGDQTLGTIDTMDNQSLQGRFSDIAQDEKSRYQRAKDAIERTAGQQGMIEPTNRTGSRGSSETKTENNVNVRQRLEMSEEVDMSNMSRREKKEFAKLVAEEMGEDFGGRL